MASSAELVAKRTILMMRRRTLPGLPKPWDTAATRAVILARLEGVSDEDLPECEADLLDVVDGAAELIAVGRQPARWWRVDNLFGAGTFERWRADVAAYRAEQDRSGRVRRAFAVEDAATSARNAGADNVVAIPVDLDPGLQTIVARYEQSTGARLPRKHDPKQLDLLGRGR